MTLVLGRFRLGDKVWKTNGITTFAQEGRIWAFPNDHTATVWWYFPLGMGEGQLTTEDVPLANLRPKPKAL